VAQLRGADLSHAELQGAVLGQAQLQGASLVQAQLLGAILSQAQLQGADLRRARLWGASLDTKTGLGLSDLQGADFTTVTAEEMTRFHAADRLHFAASQERQVLISDPKNPVFADIPTDWLITSPTPSYTTALIGLLADELASADPFIAAGIASRATNIIVPRAADIIERSNTDDWRRSLYATVACRLLAKAGPEKIAAEQGSIDLLSQALHDQKIDCEPAKPAALQ
jgi:hypothetical protein